MPSNSPGILAWLKYFQFEAKLLLIKADRNNRVILGERDLGRSKFLFVVKISETKKAS